jgi:hypothetical protein
VGDVAVAELGGQRVGAVAVAVDDRNARAARRQLAGGRRAEPGRAAGDERWCSVQAHSAREPTPAGAAAARTCVRCRIGVAERETDQTRTESSEQQQDDPSGGAEGQANGRPDERAQSQQQEQRDEQRQDDESQRDGDGGKEDGGDDDGEKSEKQQIAEQHHQERKEKEKKEKEKAEEGSGFSLKRLHWAELVGFFGALVLGGSLFLKWFGTDCITNAAARVGRECNPNSVYNGERGEFTAFETFKYLDWLLVAACVAPFILAYIIARGHKLSWKPGEVTMLVGMIAIALILLNGIILGKPGDTVDMHFEIGWLIGLIGAILLMMGGILRQALVPATRTPPGVM